MLALLREHSRSWLIWAIFIVLILVFIFFFGPQTEGFAPGSRQWAVRAPGATIFDTQLNAALQRTMDRQGSRARLDDAEFHNRRRRIGLDLAMIHVLADRAESEGLKVGHTEVSCYIVNWNRNYLRDGEPVCEQFPEHYADLYPNFDFPFYGDSESGLYESFRQDIRGRFAMSVEEYEAWKARELLALRYVDTLAAGVRVPPTAVRASWERRNDRAQLEVLPLRAEDLVHEPSEVDVMDTVVLRDAELRARFEADTERFATARTIRLQRIYLRKPLDDDDAAIAALRTRAEEIASAARAEDADFDALVSEHTDLEADRDRGGDMGERTAETLDRSLWDATVDLSEGDITVVEQSSAFSILRLSDVQEAGTPSYEEVDAVLARELLTEEATESARGALADRGRRILAIAREQGLSLQDASAIEAVETSGADPDAAIAVLASQATEPFARERSPQRFDDLGPQFASFTLPAPPPDDIPGVGRSAELARLAFTLDEANPVHLEPVHVDGVDWLVRLDARFPPEDEPTPADLSAIEAELRNALVESVVGPQLFRTRILLHGGDDRLAPVLQEILDEAVANRRIRLRDRVFRVDPAL